VVRCRLSESRRRVAEVRRSHNATGFHELSGDGFSFFQEPVDQINGSFHMRHREVFFYEIINLDRDQVLFIPLCARCASAIEALG
jgi:hypothetical protein